jgi:hypothetical protein
VNSWHFAHFKLACTASNKPDPLQNGRAGKGKDRQSSGAMVASTRTLIDTSIKPKIGARAGRANFAPWQAWQQEVSRNIAREPSTKIN